LDDVGVFEEESAKLSSEFKESKSSFPLPGFNFCLLKAEKAGKLFIRGGRRGEGTLIHIKEYQRREEREGLSEGNLSLFSFLP
jgi:hypothetical protein